MITNILPGRVEVTTFIKPLYFLHKERKALAYLGYFVAKFTHFVGYFDRPK